MIETKDLLLDKGRIADWKVMYENVWKHEGTARYTMWTAAQTKEAGYEMTHNYLAFQESKSNRIHRVRKSEQNAHWIRWYERNEQRHF